MDADGALLSAAPSPRRVSRTRRLFELFREDIVSLHPRLLIVQGLLSFIPKGVGGWLRPLLYNLAGTRFAHGARVYGKLELVGQGSVAANLRVGEHCMFTTPLYLNASEPIRIGNHVVIGHHVVIITDNHDFSDPTHRGRYRYALPVTIGDGVWIGACVTILPGVTLGEGCVVAAGAVVAKDVAPHTLVGGVPAKLIRTLPR